MYIIRDLIDLEGKNLNQEHKTYIVIMFFSILFHTSMLFSIYIYIYIMSFASRKLVQSLAYPLERMVWSYALIQVCALL